MILKFFPTRDTFITNYRKSNVPQTGSNFGYSEMLHVFKKNGVTSGSDSLARTLVKFDFSSISSSVADGTIPLASSSLFLNMFNVIHDETVPASYDLEVQLVSQSWDEGKGVDVDFFSDKGFANWDKRTSSQWWSVTGSNGTGPIATQHFDEGNEDVNVDIGDIFDTFMNGTPNNGLVVRLSSTLETSGEEYYIKKLYSRHTNEPDKIPFVEVAWDDSVITGTLSGVTKPFSTILSMYDLKDTYSTSEEVILHVFARNRDYNPAVVLTASSDVNGLGLTNAYWSVVNERTESVVIPWSTGSIKYSRLSVNNTDGNYFKIRMDVLPPGNVYKFVFLIVSGSQQAVVDDSFKFRVVQ